MLRMMIQCVGTRFGFRYQRLVDTGADRAASFAWQSQLRTYYDGVGRGTGDADAVASSASPSPRGGGAPAAAAVAQKTPPVLVRICDADFGYGFECVFAAAVQCTAAPRRPVQPSCA